MNQATQAQRQASETHARANTELEAIGTWKVRGESGPLDLTVYAAALGLEMTAMTRADELKQALASSEQRTAQAQATLVAAACSLRVSENRNQREQAVDALARERRSFDQISDVWLNTRPPSRD